MEQQKIKFLIDTNYLNETKPDQLITISRLREVINLHQSISHAKNNQFWMNMIEWEFFIDWD